MKKKAIEKIPYLTLPDTIKSKDVRYVAVTAFKDIAHEQHLFVEIYRNKKKNKDVPVVRIVVTKKDFGNYFPEENLWTRQQIKTEHYYRWAFLWSPEESTSEDLAEKRNAVFSKDDFTRIKRILSFGNWSVEEWWQYIYYHENHIVTTARRKAEDRKLERRLNALNERVDHTPPLPEKMILDRAEDVYFRHKHYLYYKKYGSWAQIACSKCGGVADGRWKAGISYESQFQKWIQEPREKHIGACPLCGAAGEYKCQGKVKSAYSEKRHLFLGQKYKESGMVMRYIEVEKTWYMGLIAGEKGEELYNASEEVSGVEIARAYFLPGENPQIDYHKHDWNGQDYWDDCNLSGLAKIMVKDAPILPETYEEMKGTMFRYCAMQEYGKTVGKYFNPIEYLSRYTDTPQIEMLVKMGLTGVVEQLLACRYGIVADIDAKSPNEFLGIRKERVRQLMKIHGDIKYLSIMQAEHRMGAVWKDSQIGDLVELKLQTDQIAIATTYMNLQQFLNRVEKYARCEYGTECRAAEAQLQATATTYLDYLTMRHDLGYDMTNSVYLYPRDLMMSHAQMVEENNQKKADDRLDEVKVRFANIRSSYRRLRNKYFYEDDRYLIRPARSAEEIVQEGRSLHHCVGGDTYLGRHNNEESYILMLRFKEYPEVPYITVEIDARTDEIRQWYGAHDKKPDEKHMKQWLDEYIHKLKAGLLGAGQEADQQADQMILMPAM